ESMSVAENIVLKDYRTSPFCRWFFLNHSQITEHARELVERFSVIAPNLWKSNTRILSGGNIQRLILGRETWREPSLIIASHPTHGLDRKAVKNIWELFMDLREKGTSILLVSEDLDEVLSLSDRVAVMFEGTFVDTVDPDAVSKQEIGLLMTGGSS
ncbi:MAG: heme ABC transporter ATP-binding protein, partial [Candidatus Bipolaricaulota bacterium]